MKKITVSLIAEKAQVSPATVSRVLNHRELVKEPTIRRVEEAMRSLGCQIENTVTVSKETQPLIVLNIPGIENVFYQEIIQRWIVIFVKMWTKIMDEECIQHILMQVIARRVL